MEGMPSTPARLRPTIVALATAITAALALPALSTPHDTTVPTAASAGPVYSGKGWKANTAGGMYSLNPAGYTIVFANSTARSVLTKYVTTPAAQLASITGFRYTVTTTIDTTPIGTCPPKGRIIIEYIYRPIGTRGASNARVCANRADGSVWGARVQMDSEYWSTPNWFSTNPTINEVYRKNLVTHELGHAAGLDHPNRDLDRDGKIEPYECDKNTSGWLPIVCSPNGGIRTTQYAGKFTALEVPGLRQMATNWYLRQG